MSASSPNRNFGRSTRLEIDGSPVVRSYLRFDLQGLSGTVVGATLRLYPVRSSDAGYDVRGVSGTDWSETRITYRNAPSLLEPPAGLPVPSTLGEWSEIDVSPLVQGPGPVSLAVTTTSRRSTSFASHEQSPWLAPQLVVTTVAGDSAVNTSPPSLSADPQDPRAFILDPGVWTGTEPIDYAYQWLRCDPLGESCVDISDQTGGTYVAGALDIGSTLRAEVTASNQAGSSSATTGMTPVLEGAGPQATSPPTVSASPRQNQASTADPGAWGGTQPIVHTYQWLRCDTVGESCLDIAGATEQQYTPGAADVGSTLRIAVGGSNWVGSSTATSARTEIVLPVGDPVIAAAGDIACDPADGSFNAGLGTTNSCRQAATASLLTGDSLVSVLPLGDLQYDCGAAGAFAQSYHASWGGVKRLSRPAIGNHEYHDSGSTGCDPSGTAAGYFDYFGAAAGDRTKGYYSFDIGPWHLIALNSNCSEVGGCQAGSPQETWLRQDLAASSAACTLAYWHHPLFSSGNYAPGFPSVRPLFQALYEHGTDVVLAGHDHIYERFARQDASGILDPGGVRQFTVGTGGRSHYAQGVPIANSEIRNNDSFGVLRLTLHPAAYSWQFAPEAGRTFTDTGSDMCDRSTPDTTAPSVPANLTAGAVTSSRVDLSWSASTDAVGVVGYDVYRNGALLTTTTPATNFSDTTVAPGTSYTYEVKARDAAGNVSEPSNSATAVTPNALNLSFSAEADARVEESHPGTNYGTGHLRADGGVDPDVESYVRFNVSGAGGTVTSAKLRVYAYTGTVNGPAVYGSSGDWTEPGLTWSNRPGTSGGPQDDKSAIGANTWVEYDVTPLVTGNGTYTFVLRTGSNDGVDIYSRESTTGLRPELILTLE